MVEDPPSSQPKKREPRQPSTRRLLEYLRTSVIGDNWLLPRGPYGPRLAVYADYTASGRALTFVERFIQERVLPMYANTHTEASAMGMQTTHLREEARSLILNSLGGDESAYVIIFCGSGATAAINKMVGLLGLRNLKKKKKEHLKKRPVVFVGPFEHHSNELPWRESGAKVVAIGEDACGHIDQLQLEHKLQHYRKRPMLIGSFSAASNVTGIISDTLAISELLHRYGALALWDFAAAGPYVDIRLNAPADRPLAYKDAVFLSPHKFIGGPGTPGILAVRRDLCSWNASNNTAVTTTTTTQPPTEPGGGTVDYVSPVEHCYCADIVQREEGGTPAIIESIRAGLIFQLKDAVGSKVICEREHLLVRKALVYWGKNKNIQILGNQDCARLPIVSLLIKHGSTYLHHNYVVALLSDLFGIQARGGCSCAGPYGHRLLHIDLERSHRFKAEILKGHQGLKPGWTRLTFSYFSDKKTHKYILRAVDLIASHGWKLLGDYRFDPATGLWQHAEAPLQAPFTLSHFCRDYICGCTDGGYGSPATKRGDSSTLSDFLHKAKAILNSRSGPADSPRGSLTWISQEFDALRWFMLPDICLSHHAPQAKHM